MKAAATLTLEIQHRSLANHDRAALEVAERVAKLNDLMEVGDVIGCVLQVEA